MVVARGRRQVVLEGLVCSDATVMAWEEGERDRWAARASALDHGREQDDWGLAATSADRLGDLSSAQVAWLITKGPEGSARALIGKAPTLRQRQRSDLGRVAVARFELDALAFALAEAADSADQLGLLVLPFRGPEPAGLVAGWLRHLGSARLWARTWLDRHAEAAARALIPPAAGRPGRVRQDAEEALRHLAVIGHGPVTIKTAEGYGPAAHTLISELLESTLSRVRADGGASIQGALFATAPPGIPSGERSPGLRKAKTPEWAWSSGLPEVRLVRGGVLTEEDVDRLLAGLSRSRPADPPEPPPGDPAPADGGVSIAVESSAARQPLVEPLDPETWELVAGCEPADLAGFGRALLDGWLSDGMPAAQAWALLAQAHVGDDATMDLLAPLVRSWPAKSRYARAIDGYAVLATVASDAALRHLLAIEENMSGGATNDRALDYLEQGAARRGLSVTQVADRLTVTHGLDAGVTIDYGPRTFTVVTDEHLTAHVRSADGRVLARPPKPGVKDTNPEAYQRFLQLKKDLRATATAQAARLEREMLAHRLRPASDLAEVVLPHPILGPIARRLLWGVYGADNRLVRALRIAEDGSFADIDDMAVVLDGDTPLGIVHPADLGEDLAAWAQIVADYEIVEPFPQMTRPAVTLTEAERAATSLPGFGPVTTERVVSLLDRGWHGDPGSSIRALDTRLAKELPGGLELVVTVEPGVAMRASYTPAAEQRITEIWVDDSWSGHWQRERRTPMGVCDPAALSEALVEVFALRG
ncbi:hypothetical protein Ait01nite_035930 [Actinoplanes italicus]|uniref:Uncharacterized protein DUF4132 n=1 Tax=Actinoplanes italicus TaxID=113567 RepID=A0A2T0K8P8_9ACTN|nr:DUF4132 domain-containing protein [Actinoplanes italicus]PRX19437.1 uncharacterized protein DUF4132 [Actinoplanes italicus]GIE30548.1 hypothetical protein Ait01nite_035930 [Actinoplanes italicus]